jgi:NAD+ synthase
MDSGSSPARLVIASAQVNPTVGDIEGNRRLARETMARASALGADLVVFPELFLIGYPPEDLARLPAALSACHLAIKALAEETKGGCGAIIGLPVEAPEGPRNAAALIDGGAVIGVTCKVDLPNYEVFDEKRVFTAGGPPAPIEFRGVKIGIPICEDIWRPGPCEGLAAGGAELLIAPNGSPFRLGIAGHRLEVARARVAATGLPLIYVNQVGGQDDLVFDGGGFVLGADGGVRLSQPLFEESLALSTWTRGQKGWTCEAAPVADWPEETPAIYRALVVGLRDYVRKSGFGGVLLGLSGGVDSALSLVIARDALGPEAVRAFMLPSRYTSAESLEDAAACAKANGVALESIPIGPAVGALDAMLAPVFAGRAADITEENLQARIRGVVLMALSNKLGLMLMTTGNKSELAVGYATLYGDMCGGFNVLKDLYKEEVYALCAWRNQSAPDGGPTACIPPRILTKAPSAELRPDQTDQDSLPPYEVLDDILHGFIEEEISLEEIVARGHDGATVKRVQGLLYGSEYKRRQSAPGVKIGPRAFGRDRRYPIVNRFREG